MNFSNKKIKDICLFIGGSQPPKTSFIHTPKEGYIRLIQVRDRLNDNFITYIPKESTKKLCEPNDILIGRYGPPIFQIFRGFKGAYNVAIMKASPINGVNNDFLYYFLKQNSILKYVESMSLRTAGQTGVELESLYEYPVKLPDAEGQRKIADILKNIDNKIANNNKINAELESLAKTIYDYWLLQFEFPNEEGKPYKSSGGKMVANEKLNRMIPDGWKNGNLYDIAEFTNGLACQKHRPIKNDQRLPVIKIREMHNGFTSETEWVRDDIPQKYVIDDGDILFSWSATLETIIWTGGQGALNQHIFKVSEKNCAKYYVFMQLAEYVKNFVAMAEARKTTMGHITSDHLNQSRVVLPCTKVIDSFEQKVTPLFTSIIKNKQESIELSKLREFLLPLLMNGQVGFIENE